MPNLLRQIKMEKREHLILSILLILYILLEVHLPASLSEAVDSIYGKVVLYLLALHIFFNVSKVAGVLALVAVYTMIKRASMKTGTFAMREYLPSEERKVMDFSKFNDYKDLSKRQKDPNYFSPKKLLERTNYSSFNTNMLPDLNN